MKKRITCFLLALLMVLSILPPQTFAADVETDSGKHPMMGELVAISPSTGVYYHAPGGSYSFVNVLYFADRMEIVAVDESTGTTYYQLNAAPGCSWKADSLGHVELHDGIWVKASDTIHLVYCEDCKEYNCGIDHTTDPSNPSDPVDPNAPSISATVTDADGNPVLDANGNPQTVTVSGNALPEGARLEVTPVENEAEILADLEMDGGFIWDIKVYDADGNEWQPDEGQTVSICLPISGVPNNCYVEIAHYLDSVSSVGAALTNGDALVCSIDGEPSGITAFLSPSITAWQQATGKADNTYVVDINTNVKVIDGYANIKLDSFSIFSYSGGYQDTSYDDNPGTGTGQSRIIVCLANSQNSSGETFYAHRDQYIVFDTGSGTTAKRNWKLVKERGTDHSFSSTSNYYAELTINSEAALGTKLKIEFNGSQLFKNYGHVYIVVIENRPVNYYSNDGSGKVTTVNAITDGYGTNQNATAPSISRAGYNFKGWYDAPSGGTRLGGAGLSIMPSSASGQDVYAQWEPIKYTIKFDPNTANAAGGTVTGSMADIAMTYDVATTLPRSKYVNSGDGVVFLGWATSPTGDVVYKDGQQVSNLTTTDGATVTLYAKWKYGLASTVYVGINNSYHDPKGTYVAGGVEIKSYHTYPNEPAQMTGNFDRVTDTSGSWTYNSASAVPLKNQANAYINGNIFNSPDYEMTYVSGENTLGIADPTGKAVRAMLKFSEADYNAMIAAWLNGMRSTLVSYGDTTFDWQNAKAEDFVMVPYVIKFQDFNSWYIDMVVVPKALYTLAYDGNIENGYTATFTGVAFPPSTQYRENDTVNVVTTPIGYNSNGMKVTKVVDGHTYEAKFQYWYDAEGNTYGGTTGRNSFKITKDTILYAKWEYPDALYGNLEVTKTVVDKDSYTDPPQNQTFTFTFKTSASGSYNYTVYDRSANVQKSGTISNNGTFTLQDGWRVRITDIPKGATYTITETAVSYFTATSTLTGTISAGATTYATVTNTYQKNAAYTVKHFLQKSDKTGYTEQTLDSQALNGVIGTNTAATAKNYSGYAVKTFSQETILANGTTVVEIYYDLLPPCTVTGSIDNGGSVTDSYQQITHGNGSKPMVFKPATGHKITGITVTVNGVSSTVPVTNENEGGYTYPAQTNVTGNIAVAVTTAKKTYTVTYYVDGAKYSEATFQYGAEVTLQGTPGTKAGHSFSGWTVTGATVTDNKFSMPADNVTITGVWTENSYKVRFNANEGTGTMADQLFTYGEKKALTANAFTRAGYNFIGWNTQKNATVAAYADKAEVEKLTEEKDGVVVLYAIWELNEANYTIEIYREQVDSDDYDKTVVSNSGIIGTEISVSANDYSAEGLEFDASNSGNVLKSTITADGNMVLKLYYKRIRYTVTGTMDGATKFEQIVKHGASSSEMTFTPATGYKITGVTVNDQAQTGFSASSYTYPAQTNVTGNIMVAVTTAKKTFVVNATIDDGGTITGTFPKTVEYGTVVEIAFTPKSGYKITSVKVNGTNIATFDEKGDKLNLEIKEATDIVITTERNVFTVTFKDWNETVLESKEWIYGETPYYDADDSKDGLQNPVRASDEQYDYEFAGWTPEISDVTGNVTYKATYISHTRSYTITWVDGNGKTLHTETWAYNTMPQYTGVKTPTKTATDQYTYTFNNKWSPEITKVTGNATYTAQFDATVNKYTITWVDGDGNTLKTEQVEYGKTPVYSGEKPTKTATDQYTYTFNNKWSPEIATVTGNATYTAQFDATVNKYTITWVDGDGNTLKTEQVEYGKKPVYSGENPTKLATAQYTYTWNTENPWSPAIVSVTGDATYTAQFTQSIRTYTVTWWQDLNENDTMDDGEVLETDKNVPYGDTPSFDGEEPKKEHDSEYYYLFAGWNPSIIDYVVTGDVSFKAQFKEVLERYDVVWKNRDGTTLETDKNVLYGQMPEYNGKTPVYVPEPDDGYTYTFDSWTPALTPVFNTQEYVAVYKKTKISYSITYDLNGGALPAGKSNPTSYHVETETFLLHNPERTGYTFTGWTGSNGDTPQTSVSVVTGTTGNLTFTANWQANNVGYKVVHWKQAIGGGSEHNETNFPNKEVEALFAEAESNVAPNVKNYEGFTAPTKVEVTIAADGSTVVNYYYTRNTYTIHFNANEGTGTMDSLTLAYDQSTKLTVNAFARRGYSFKGWATAANGGVVYADQKEVKNLSVQNGARIDLYAVWEINLFNLIIKTNNTVDENQSYIFTVSGTGYDGTNIRLQVALGANDEQKIVGVPAGIYTVADQNGWSWRYEHQEIKDREVVTDQVADFYYTYSKMIDTKIYWLNGYGNDLLRLFDNKRKK